jgi:hypothetical protein
MSSSMNNKQQQERAIYEITRLEASVLVELYAKCHRRSALKPKTSAADRFVEKTARMAPCYMGTKISDEATRKGHLRVSIKFYNLISDLFDEIEVSDKVTSSYLHNKITEVGIVLGPINQEVIYNAVNSLVWAVYNWKLIQTYDRNTCVPENLEDVYEEEATCDLCKFVGFDIFSFSTTYGLNTPICSACVETVYEEDDDEEYVSETEEEEEEEEEEAVVPVKKNTTGTSMTAKYMNFSPDLVNERNRALNDCESKSGRCEIYKVFHMKMKAAYENAAAAAAAVTEDEAEAEEEQEAEEGITVTFINDDDEDDDDVIHVEINETTEPEVITISDDEEEEDDEEEDDDDEDYEPEEDEEEDDEEEYYDEYYDEEDEEKVFSCEGCNYEWRDGWKKGWRDAMKHMRIYARKQRRDLPIAPHCAYCNVSNSELLKCSGTCNGVRYCSAECQQDDWQEHRSECRKQK